MELHTGKFFIHLTWGCFNLWGTQWDCMLLLSGLGYWGGRSTPFLFGNKPPKKNL